MKSGSVFGSLFILERGNNMFYYENNNLISFEIPQCENLKDEFFRYFIFERGRRQGWKIHISCTVDNHLNIINVVGDYLLENKISFKYIDNINSLYYLLSGDAPYGQAGKFVTIYPKSDKQFKSIIEDLYPKLYGMDGIYIISDRQFKDSIIYYRFGLFENDGIPYLIDGLAGLVFIALELYKLTKNLEYKTMLEKDIIKPYCETLRRIKWCKTSGLFFGGLGVVMIVLNPIFLF
ncbi:class III lanthionine synthetase LanKC N-terminal domain-containing protein [Streptococcus sciuri]|uniref:RamC N-terminal domain-containing protein n=1 Tax=Streptococcus sciuri TaxID=2973939 RepID=A0ABT2F6K9_9STRE|nr:hypothetical protein [Streptococcus sciuri]MCS4487828.1 hypothetical protein [Streptococcus sciuri]